MESSALLNSTPANQACEENGMETVARVRLARQVYTKSLEREKEKENLNLKSIGKKLSATATECCTLTRFLSVFPILTWLPKYHWKTDLIPDILAGFTVGIMSIPQGMAYARLGGISPVYGLYTNIVAPFVYFFFGTTKHAAIGPATVLMLITASVRYKYIPCQDCWRDPNNSSILIDENGTILVDDTSDSLDPIDIGSALPFLVGVFLLIMGAFRLSFIADYLPDSLVGGFTVAAAIQVFTGQLGSIFGVKLPNRHGPGKVLMNYFDLFGLITHTNVPTILIFLCCFVFLVSSKKLLNPIFQAKLKVPFPGEFIVMVASAIASYYLQFGPVYSVSTVKHVPAGFPAPRLPKFSIMGMLLADAFVFAVITYSYSISLAKLYAKRNGYRVHTTQEFYAYGFMNLIGSFFQCLNSGQSVARSLVYEMAGAKSQLCGLLGTLVVIFTVIFITPLLASLPNTALAAIIVTACLEMFHNMKQLPSLFHKCKYDFSIFLMSLVSVVVLDVTYGLAISVTFALITVVLRSQRAKLECSDEETRLLYTSDQMDKLKADDTIDQSIWDRIRVWRLTSPIFYANAERVKNEILERNKAFNKENEMGSRTITNSSSSSSSIRKSFPPLNTFDQKEIDQPSIVIVDMTAVAFMDLMGVNAMKETCKQMKQHGILVFLCGCTVAVESLMRKSGFPENDDVYLFPTVLDGIYYTRFYFQTGITPTRDETVSSEKV